ncbi:MAG: response regulator, partial [Desulfuromonadales bacterium]
MVLLCSALVLLLASIFFVTTEIFSFRHSLLDKSRSLAQIIGTNSREALTFKRPFAAEEVLASLEKESHVVRAYLFDQHQEPFAHYIKAGNGEPPAGVVNGTCSRLPKALDQFAAGHCFTWGHLAVFHPIISKGRTLGFVYLETGLGGLYERLGRYGLIVLGSLAALFIFGIFVSMKLQKFFSLPIMHLAEKMDSVRNDRDFSVRMDVTSRDEIGLVSRGFNEMLGHLQDREAMLLHYQHNLESMVEQRTRELEEARQDAEEATRTKSRFLANMSHEIRTPMSGVLGMTELLQKTGLDEHQKNLADSINNSGQTLLALLNDLLDYSKMEAGKFQLQSIDFDLHTEIEDSVFLLAERAYSKKLDLVCRIRPDTPRHVHGDPMRLRQVLVNLVANAIKFTDQGEIRVDVEPLCEGDARLHLSFKVSDTGIGISDEDRQKIFDSFSQGAGSQGQYAGGTGLGLSIARELITLMDGSISAESYPGEGSRFSFDLKFKPAVQMLDSPSHADTALNQERVLIIDDNASTRQMVCEFFQAQGIVIDQSAEAAHAISLLREAAGGRAPYTMVLVDTTMPEPAGLELIQKINRMSDIPPARIALMCLPGQSVAQETLQDYGAQCCLIKPIRTTRLFESISEWLARPANEVVACHAEPGCASRSSDTVADGPSPVSREGAVHVLVAEDNPTVQKLLRLHLNKRGVVSVFVDNGREAVESFTKGDYDAILMDCNMPEMDGLEATRLIRQKGDTVPIIALSAHVGEQEIDGFLKAGMNDYLHKPFK